MKTFMLCFFLALMSGSTISVMRPSDQETTSADLTNDIIAPPASSKDPNQAKIQHASSLVDKCTSLSVNLESANCDDSVKMQKLLFQSTQGACKIIIESYSYYNDLRALIEPSLTNTQLGDDTGIKPAVETNLN